MNLCLKNIILLVSIPLAFAMWNCKKEKAPTTNQNHLINHDSIIIHLGPDFRDSLVGNYYCIKHYYSWTVPNIVYDSIIGPTIVAVSKLSTDDSSIVANGSTFTIQYPTNNQTIKYLTINNFGTPDYFFFTIHNDSIWCDSCIWFQGAHQQSYYYTGRKQ